MAITDPQIYLQQELVLEQMVGMLIGPAAIFSLGSLIVGMISILYSGTKVKGAKEETRSIFE